MTGAHPEQPADTERFDTGGRATGWVGLVLCVFLAVGWWVLPGGPLPGWVLSGAVLSGLLFWSAIIRPSVSATGDTLVLRNMFEDVRIPLAAIQEHAVRQVLAVRVADKRYVGSGIGRSFAASRSTRVPAPDGGATRGIHPADYVETRIAGLAADARDRARVRHRSEEQAALAADVERTPTWRVIGPLAVSLVALAVSIALA
ncbi:MAG: hypothetical protein LH468_09545 [Nocardioides sp.]|nr:hypothetical protein [Nocardioides sp.]